MFKRSLVLICLGFNLVQLNAAEGGFAETPKRLSTPWEISPAKRLDGRSPLSQRHRGYVYASTKIGPENLFVETGGVKFPLLDLYALVEKLNKEDVVVIGDYGLLRSAPGNRSCLELLPEGKDLQDFFKFTIQYCPAVNRYLVSPMEEPFKIGFPRAYAQRDDLLEARNLPGIHGFIRPSGESYDDTLPVRVNVIDIELTPIEQAEEERLAAYREEQAALVAEQEERDKLLEDLETDGPAEIFPQVRQGIADPALPVDWRVRQLELATALKDAEEDPAEAMDVEAEIREEQVPTKDLGDAEVLTESLGNAAGPAEGNDAFTPSLDFGDGDD